MFPELKIKIKSLAAEIAMIHVDELKYRRAHHKARAQIRLLDGHALSHRAIRLMGGDPKEGKPPRKPGLDHRDAILSSGEVNGKAWDSLYKHRMELKVEYRSALLAYGFLRGRPYCVLERKVRRELPNWGRVLRLAQKFGGARFNQAEFDTWLEEASAHIG